LKTLNRGYFYLFNTVILFSTYEVVSKTLVGKIDPFQINFIRFLVGGVILFIFILIKGNLHIKKKDFILVAFVGVINVVFSMNLLQLSLSTGNAEASIVAVIFSSNPIFVFIFSVIFDKERVHLYKIIGFLFAVAGIATISIAKSSTGTWDYKSPLFAILSAILYGLYTFVGRKASVKVGSLKMNAYSFLIGSLVLLPMLIFFKIPVLKFDYSNLWQVAYLSILVTGFAYLTYFKGLSDLGASKGSMIFFVKPVLASIIAILFLKEALTYNLFIGTVLIIGGIVIAIYWQNIKAFLSKKSNKLKQSID
jgi:drug/metabolite transporter (DMT)-like permease